MKYAVGVPVYASILAALLLWPPSTDQPSIDIGMVSLYLAMTIIVVGVHCILHNESNWMRIDTVFIVGYLIVNMQWPAMMLLSEIFPIDTRMRVIAERYGTFGTWLATIGLTSWAIGFLLNQSKNSARFQQIKGINTVTALHALLMLAFVILAGQEYFSGAIYSETQENLWSTISGLAGYVFTIMTITAVVVMLAILYRFIVAARTGPAASIRTLLSHPAMLLTGAYLLMFIIAGERGQVVQLLMAATIALCSNLWPVRAPTFALLIVGGSAFISLLGFARAYGYGDLASFFGDYDIWKTTLNLANSAITLYLGIEIVEMRGSFFWGQLWITNLLGVIPMAQSLFINFTGIPFYELNSAYLITYHVFGERPHTGFGTSIAIDVYMNAGVGGVVALMALYGKICQTFQQFIRAEFGFRRFLIAGLFASLVFYATRSSYFVQLQPVVWGYLISLAFIKISEVNSVGGTFKGGRTGDQ